MVGVDTQQTAYVDSIQQWRQTVEDRLRAEDGWLTLIGLFWLHEGTNSVGADSTADVPICAAGIPDQLATIDFHDGHATLHVNTDMRESVTVDGVPVTEAALRDDFAEGGPSLVKVGSVTFFVIRRGDEFAVRVRDANNPARLNFAGRNWFPVDLRYKVDGQFIPHETSRSLPIANSAGQTVMMSNPGKVEFTLDGQAYLLEAFAAGEGELWFVFKDATSAHSTYGAGRFLYAPISPEGVVGLDFNKAYHPPCAFTPYATCPRPPKGNAFPIEILAGERH